MSPTGSVAGGLAERIDAAGAKKPCEERRRITREDYGRAEVELRKAVVEGKISGERARARLGAMRKMMGRKSEDAARKITREDWESIKKRIEGAVQRGDITREEADAKYRAIKEWMDKRRQRVTVHRPGGDCPNFRVAQRSENGTVPLRPLRGQVRVFGQRVTVKKRKFAEKRTSPRAARERLHQR